MSLTHSYNWREMREKKAFLAFEDGTVMRGHSVGAKVDNVGEVVFNTGLCGYQEILSDPSYAGQFVTMTYPEIGNYGTNVEDMESRGLFLNGFVIHEYNESSSWRSGESLGEFLAGHKVPCIAGIDTRMLTCKLRRGGSLSWDLLGQLLFGKVGDSETIKISTGAIPDLAEINNREEYSLPVLNEQVIKDLNNPSHAGINVNTAYSQEFTVENDAYLSIDASVQYNAGSDIVGFGIDGMVWLEKFNGTSWVSVQQGTIDQLLISLSVYQLSVTKGRFRVRWDVVCGYTDVQGPSATITLNKYCEINYKLNVKKLVIGIDGIALFDSMSDKYLRLSLKDNVAQLRMKLDTDMPGVLASGSVTSGGGNQNPWGAKKSTNNATYTATGIYDVPHNAGSIYQVQVTPTADNIECKVVSKSNNTFRVQVRSNSGTDRKSVV